MYYFQNELENDIRKKKKSINGKGGKNRRKKETQKGKTNRKHEIKQYKGIQIYQ